MSELTALLMAMQLFAKPTTDRPTISDADAKAEARTQAEYIVRADLEDQRRLYDVAARIYVANREFCQTAPKLGMRIDHAASYGTRLAEAARNVMGGTDAPYVTHVYKDWAADKAGVQVGDTISKVDGIDITPNAKGHKALMNQISQHAKSPDRPLELVVTRAGQSLPISVPYQNECAYDVRFEKSEELNAYADGSSINITSGIMRFTRSDEELALVVAHELAHNTEGHMKAKNRNAAIGAIGGGLLDIAIAAAAGVNTNGAFSKTAAQSAAGAYSPEFESEADYVGIYFMARSGYDTTKVADFWRRMSVESPGSVFVKTSHPTNPSRYLSISSTTKQVQAKRDAGQPLTPDRIAKPSS